MRGSQALKQSHLALREGYPVVRRSKDGSNGHPVTRRDCAEISNVLWRGDCGDRTSRLDLQLLVRNRATHNDVLDRRLALANLSRLN